LDVLLIITVSVTAGASYAQVNQGDVDLTRYVSTAILAGVVFVLLFRRRCLYDPSSLVNWSLQARNIVTLWTVTFLVLAGVAFALKIGKDFSRPLEDQEAGARSFVRFRDHLAGLAPAGLIGELDPVFAGQILWFVGHGAVSLLTTRAHFPWLDRDALVATLEDIVVKGLAAAKIQRG